MELDSSRSVLPVPVCLHIGNTVTRPPVTSAGLDPLVEPLYGKKLRQLWHQISMIKTDGAPDQGPGAEALHFCWTTKALHRVLCAATPSISRS